MQPCGCISSGVHPECLQQWNLQRSVGKQMTHCEVCKVPYWGSKWRLFAVMIIVWLYNVMKQLFVNLFCYIFNSLSQVNIITA